jgi:putative DNA primase/helicase
MEIKQATQRLGYTALSAGIWLEGSNGFGQYRPNKPWKSEGEKKAPKYRTATKEEYDAMLPRHPHNPRYWEDLDALKKNCYHINGHPCLLITEGLFKALAGCFHGFPTVALPGVEQGLTSSKNDPQGKRYLVNTLELLARAKFGWIIAFDADDNAKTNKNVMAAQRKLACQLAKFKVPVYIATGNWSAAEGKGMDDYIQSNGSDAFRDKVLAKAVNFETWERQFQENDLDNKILSESGFAGQIAEDYRARLAWHVANKAWYWYEAENKQGVWGEIPSEEAMSIVITELETRTRHFSSKFVNGVLTLLKAKLRINHWEVRKGFICLQDCVLDVNTLKEYPHEPGYRMLTQLPFKWADRSVGCEPVKQWLLEACEGKGDWVQLIRAGINATVTERGGELQRFMELVGAGGTGKGTLLRLVQALLGRENYAITELKQLEQNRFETAALYGKKAVFITDSERYTGDVSTLKKLTGDDELRHEKKGVQQTGSFRFHGLVWIASNEIIQSSDYTNALARRRVSIPFERIVPQNERRPLEKQFEPYLPGVLQWVLEMPADDVAAYVGNTNNKVPSLASFSTEVLLSTNPLADWANDCLYYDDRAQTQIGDNGQNPELFLYPNYCEWAQRNSHGIMTKQRFSAILLNLLKSQLNIDAAKVRNKKGRFLTKIAIRQSGQDFPLLISERDADIGADLNSSNTNLGADIGADIGADPVLTSMLTESIDSADLQSDADLFTNKNTIDTINQDYLMHTAGSQNQQDKSAQSAPPALARVSASTNASTTQKEVSTTQRIIEAWEDRSTLGEIVLSLESAELQQIVKGFSPEQLQHIKDAANSVWRLGADSIADYNGELVYIWECGQSNDIRIGTKTQPGVRVKRAHLRPWLGI